MPNFYSPNGNLEVWDKKPKGYFTIEEWQTKNPIVIKEPSEFEKSEVRKLEIYARLDEIDLASLRPLRAIYNKTATDFDKQKLKDLEAEANALREELAELKKPKVEETEVANAE